MSIINKNLFSIIAEYLFIKDKIKLLLLNKKTTIYNLYI